MFKEAVLIVLIDLIWLSVIHKRYGQAVADIQQGEPMQTRMLYAVVVYLALGYLLTQVHDVKHAFLLGVSVYAVYDFTMLALFKKYDVKLALADTLWGGILMGSAFYINKHIVLSTPSALCV